MKRTYLIAGGTGFIGRHLTAYLRSRGDRVRVLTRGPDNGPDEIHWNGESLGAWTEALEGADALINLCGKSVNCRYTPANRAAIFASRLDPTRILAIALANTVRPPALWLNASSATIYRHAEDRDMDETTGEIGRGFSVQVCQQWEQVFFAPELPGIRRVALRSAMTFGPGKGGVFAAFQGLVNAGLGGTMGSGRQFVSWIHLEDFCRAVDWITDHPELDGAINLAAPDPLPNRNFLAILRRGNRQRIGLPAAPWMLATGAWLLRTETELLLKSRRVIPKRLMESGFQFKYPTWPEAVAQLVGPKRGSMQRAL